MSRRLVLALVGLDRDLAAVLSVAARGYARAATAVGRSVPPSLLAVAKDLDEFVAISGQLPHGSSCQREDGCTPMVLTISEAAAMARISPRSVRRRLADGSLRHWRAGRQVRINLDDLVTWMESRTR